MSRIRVRRLLERDRLDPRCPVCRKPRDGRTICEPCESAIVDELLLEEAEWWTEPEFQEPDSAEEYTFAGAWDDEDDLDPPF